MASTSLLSLGTQAVFAAYAQLQTTSNNIANANTPGYSRQSVELATAGTFYNGSGYLGRGVTVQTINRASNMFLTGQAVRAASASTADGVRHDMLSQLEKVFGGGEAGLGAAATQIFNAYADLAAAPTDRSARQAVLGRLEDFASLARASSGQIEALQANVLNDVQGAVSEVNTLAKELVKLNVSIVAATNRGHMPNDLLDQRDQLVKRIAEQVEVHTFIAPDETASVFVGSGQTLVLGDAAHALEALPDPSDPSHVTLGVRIAGQLTALSTDAVGDGAIGGLMRFQDQDLADARSRLGQLVAGLASALNQQQALGLDLQGQPGTPLFGYSAALAVPGTGNARDGSGSYLASVNLQVVEASALKASDYRLEPDLAAPGLYTVTRLADGQVFAQMADGATIDGFQFSIGPNAPQPGESFTLKPVSRAAADLSLLLKNPLALAAANPVIATLPAANTGSASITALTINQLPAAPYGALTVQFTDDSGAYQLLDGSNNVLDLGQFSAGQPIVWDGIALSLAGLPRSGDAVLITPTTHPGASNGNALRFDSLASSLLIDGQTAGDAYANAMAALGVRVQGAAAAADNSATVATRADAEVAAQTGVNLDEEAARLIQFQQNYQAAAKMLQTAQTLFDTIIAIGR